ncbi:MAG: leucine--tRNA ligase [Ktedonobacterales bacterium]
MRGAEANTDTKRVGGKARPPTYDWRAIEAEWRAKWEEQRLYQPDLRHAKRPYYNLQMFPYPSAEGLHVGNMYSYVGSDAHGRYMAMRGYDVFEPMGFDAFGIHSENFAIKQGAHPRPMTARNIERFRDQLQRIGNRFDWSHEVRTTDPEYFRWTQWIFIQLFKAGLVERKAAPVNWCPNDKTVLADEQVIGGRCERCDAVVERRKLEQWFFKITRYADRLLDNLDRLDWSERVKTAQRHWIGRSAGTEFEMAVEAHPEQRIRVFTTRVDTIFGMTYVALAPEHPLIAAITSDARRRAIAAFLAERQTRSEHEQPDGGESAGIFTGAYAIHPITNERVPIWIADYVLMEYGTGAIMAVPAHDERDAAFAAVYGLDALPVIESDETAGASAAATYAGAGRLVASGEYTGMATEEARTALGAWLEASGVGGPRVRYHLRDWLISRQRYWGPPIPIIYCPEHGAVPVPESDLPVLLPYVADYRPTGTGVSPLAADEEFVRTVCPICGQPARRETDVNDNFLDSAWYYLRYPSSDDHDEAWNAELTRKWLPVSMYVGGAEHSVLHLLYARFITMALHDLGHVPFEEPFPRFRANGTLTKDGKKISKSRGNVVNPDTYVERYGADVFRTHLLFMGPFEESGDFSDAGIGGIVRFLDRVLALVESHAASATNAPPTGERRAELHRAIQRVTSDIEQFKYNTVIAALMKYTNSLARRQSVSREALRAVTLMLAPFAPYASEELWRRLGGESSVHSHPWPSFDAAAVVSETVTIVVQVNGRVRDRLTLATDTTEAEARAAALASPRVAPWLAQGTVRQVIYVPGRLVNVVVE